MTQVFHHFVTIIIYINITCILFILNNTSSTWILLLHFVHVLLFVLLRLGVILADIVQELVGVGLLVFHVIFQLFDDVASGLPRFAALTSCSATATRSNGWRIAFPEVVLLQLLFFGLDHVTVSFRHFGVKGFCAGGGGVKVFQDLVVTLGLLLDFLLLLVLVLFIQFRLLLLFRRRLF